MSEKDVLDTELGQTIYKRLLQDGIDREFFIADIARGMYEVCSAYHTQKTEEKVVIQMCIDAIGGLRYSGDPSMQQYNHAIDQAVKTLELIKRKKPSLVSQRKEEND